MTRRGFLAGAAAFAQTPPVNLIVILADDLGWAELGCYGNRFNETPNLDRLAREGVRFTQAYAAAPVCSPTRAALMTGHHPRQVGILDFLRADDPNHLSPKWRTLPKTLRGAGYRCGLVGKWHLMGDYRSRPGDPARHGFDEVMCSESRYIGPGYYYPPWKHMPEIAPRTPREYLTDRLNDEAVGFIERNASRPFFLYLAHYAPHTTLMGKPELVEKYRAKPGAGKDRNNPELAAMLESIDQGVGANLATLEKLKLRERTAILFLSDNGGETRVTTNAPLRMGKSTLYEGGVRVPMLLSGPGVARGKVETAPVWALDVFPTCLDFARAQGPKLEGASLRKPPKERTLFWYYPLDKPHFLGGRSAQALRRGRWKLIEFLDDGSRELYDLENDPDETRNLADAQPARVESLSKELRAALHSHDKITLPD